MIKIAKRKKNKIVKFGNNKTVKRKGNFVNEILII